MKRKTKKAAQTAYGENYLIFLGLIDKMDEFETDEIHYWLFKDLTRREIALLNGYIVNSCNYEQFHLSQTWDLHNLEVVQTAEQSIHPLHDLAFYCQRIDQQNRINIAN